MSKYDGKVSGLSKKVPYNFLCTIDSEIFEKKISLETKNNPSRNGMLLDWLLMWMEKSTNLDSKAGSPKGIMHS